MDKTLQGYVICFLLLFLSACGGGSEGDSTEETTVQSNTEPRSISTNAIRSGQIGTVLNFDMTGTDSDGSTLSGSILLANREKTTVNGVMVTPVETMITIDSPSFPSISIFSVGYKDESGSFVSVETPSNGLNCIPIYMGIMPLEVKSGDFGALGTLSCSDGTTMEMTWRAEEIVSGTFSGSFSIVVTTTMLRQTNTVSSSSNRYYVSDDGTVIGISIEATTFDPIFYSFNLSSR